MTTEISSTLTAAGLGQSTAVSIGGDAIIGSTYTELMPLFEADEQTQAIVIYTEPGGRMEAELARARDREQLAAADRRLHGRPLHGRDARHELRPRRHDRRGQGRHRHREDRAPARGRASPSRRRSPRSPTSSRSGSARWRRERADGIVHRRRGRRLGRAAIRSSPGSSRRPAPSTSSRPREQRRRDRRGEPRRVRALLPVRRRVAARHRHA